MWKSHNNVTKCYKMTGNEMRDWLESNESTKVCNKCYSRWDLQLENMLLYSKHFIIWRKLPMPQHRTMDLFKPICIGMICNHSKSNWLVSGKHAVGVNLFFVFIFFFLSFSLSTSLFVFRLPSIHSHKHTHAYSHSIHVFSFSRHPLHSNCEE